MRSEPVVSAAAWVAATWWIILSAIAGVFSVTAGDFSTEWVSAASSRFYLVLIGSLVGLAVATVLITSYRRSRSSILSGATTLTGRTTLGPYPGYWKLKPPTALSHEQLFNNDKLNITQKIATFAFLSMWLRTGQAKEASSDQSLSVDHLLKDDFKRAFLDVLCIYATRPQLPATTRSGFHGTIVNPILLIDHALSVADAALRITPDFIYRGLVSRPKKMPVLPPRDSHYMPDTFKSECPVGLIALTAMAHDLGKVFTFEEDADGRVSETKGKHGPVGARMISRIPSIQALHPQHIRTLTAVLAHYHACHTLPLDVDLKSGEMMIRDDKTVAVMEIVIAADKEICSKEASATVALSDYESDMVPVLDKEDALIWESVFLALMPSIDRKPINGGNHERLGFKYKERVYLIEEALNSAVLERVGNIQKPGERGGVNTLTEAILLALKSKEILVTDYDGKQLHPSVALYTVEFTQPEKMIAKQGLRKPKTYKRMIVIPAKNKHFDFSDLLDCPMEPKIIAPTLGKHRAVTVKEDPTGQLQTNDLASEVARTAALEQQEASCGDERNREAPTPVAQTGKPIEKGLSAKKQTAPKSISPTLKLDSSHVADLMQPKAKKRKHPKKLLPVAAPIGPTNEQATDELEPPTFAAAEQPVQPDLEGEIEVQIDAKAVRQHIPAIQLVLANIHKSGGSPRVVIGDFKGAQSLMTRLDHMTEIYPSLPWQQDSLQTLIKTTASTMTIHKNEAGRLILVVTA